MHRHCNNTHVNTLKHILLLTLVLATSAFCSSCNEEESAIGMGLQDPATLYAGTNDTLYGSAMTLLDDSLMTTNYSLGLLGYVSDNVFGTADASIYTQIACTSESGINYANSTIDSVVLSITVNEFTSNVSRGAVPLHFQVTPLLSPISTDHLYYSTDTIATDTKHFFNGTVYVTPNKDTTTIRLCLNSRANALFEGKTYTKAEFMAAVNGIRIRLVDNRQPVMMTVNFAAQNTKLTVYRQYHESDTTSEALQDGFSISTGARHFNHYRHRYIGDLATFNTNRKDSVNGSQHLYLDPMGGTRIKLDFDSCIKAFHTAHPNAVIHYAELLLPVSDDSPASAPPDDLLAFRCGIDTTSYVYDMIDPYSSAGFDGTCHQGSTNKYYRLRITQHLQKLLRDGKDYGTLLVINSRRASAKRAVINGYAHNNPPRIAFVYSE